MAVPGIGVSAPDFNLPRDGGGRVSLAEFHGKPLVLFFIPRTTPRAAPPNHWLSPR